MAIDFAALGMDAITVLIYGLLGLVLFGVAFRAIAALVPFSLRKEIEVDQNEALGWILASVIVGIALIIAAAIRG